MHPSVKRVRLFCYSVFAKEFEGGGAEEHCQCLVKMMTRSAWSYQEVFSGHEVGCSVCPKFNWAEKILPPCRASLE